MIRPTQGGRVFTVTNARYRGPDQLLMLENATAMDGGPAAHSEGDR